MAKFHVKNTFEDPERRAFVLVGTILEGEIQPGMFVHVPMNSELGIRMLVVLIEDAPGEDTRVGVMGGPNVSTIYRGFNLCGETFEVAPVKHDDTI